MSDPIIRLITALEGSGKNHRILLLIIATLLLLLLGGGGKDDPTGRASPIGVSIILQPSEFCSDHSEHDIATFEDANLEARLMGALSVGAQEDLTCGLISRLTVLATYSALIESLMGVQNLTGLTLLNLMGNSISDISALSGLTSLKDLWLHFNSIIDISALSGLTSLNTLHL